MIVYLQDKTEITIEDIPFARGGEGAIHKIKSPSSFGKMCAKLYFPQQRNKERQDKLDHIIQNPPSRQRHDYRIVCWPEETLFVDDEFVGFIMPLAYDDSIQLYELCTPRLKPSLGTEWSKFERANKDSFTARMKLCVNLAAAINDVHALNNFTFVDLKPQNILVTNDGKISLIDCDSIQISKGQKMLYPSKVATQEYVPPEGKDIDPAITHVSKSWDRFSLAVIFYEILFGIHPFTASFSGKYGDCTSIDSKIRNGLFVFGNKKHYVSVLPPFHNQFLELPDSIKSLFEKTFIGGIENPKERPTAEVWGMQLFKIVKPEDVKVILPCPKCGHKLNIPKHKQIKTSCPKCNSTIQAKNGSLLGYVSKDVVYVDRPITKTVYVDKPIETIKTVYVDKPIETIKTELVQSLFYKNISILLVFIILFLIMLNFYLINQNESLRREFVKTELKIKDSEEKLLQEKQTNYQQGVRIRQLSAKLNSGAHNVVSSQRENGNKDFENSRTSSNKDLSDNSPEIKTLQSAPVTDDNPPSTYSYQSSIVSNPVIDIYLRESASVNSKKTMKLNPNQIVYIISKSTESELYLKVYTNGRYGYVSKTFVRN